MFYTIKMGRFIFFLVIILFFAFSCQEISVGVSKKDSNRVPDASRYFASVQQFFIDPEVAYQLGAEFVDFFYNPNDTSLILTERNSGVMAKINQGGQIVWKLKTPTASPRKIMDIANGDRNPLTGHFYIYDRTQKKIFVIDENSNILSFFRPEIDFIDFAILRNGSIAYNTEGFHNTHVTGESQAYKYMVYDSSGVLWKKFFPHPLPIFNHVFNDYDDFSRVGGNLFYNKQFTDTTFLVTEENIIPSYVAKVNSSSRSQELVNDPSLEDPFVIIYNENVPSVLKSVKSEKYRYERFGVHGRSKFLIRDSTNEVVLQSNMLFVNGNYFSVPRYYNDGYYFSVMYRNKYDMFQSESVSDKSILPGIEATTDKDGLVVTVLEIR